MVGRLGLEPDLIITHTPTDLNMDHRLTCETAKIAARPITKPVSLLCAEIPDSSYWNGVAFAANYYVDISQTLETKIQAFEQYTEEVRPFPHPWSRDGLTLLAQYRGMQAGLGRAEAFMLIRGYDQRLPYLRPCLVRSVPCAWLAQRRG
jgi:N-acetylglucosamine malate deacetylase 1